MKTPSGDCYTPQISLPFGVTAARFGLARGQHFSSLRRQSRQGSALSYAS